MSEDNITIGGQEYVVKAAPIARITKALRQLGDPIRNILNDPDDISVEKAIGILTTQFGSNAESFLRSFVPTLPAGFLSDEEHGPSIPELIDAFQTIIRVNRIDSVNSFFRKLVPPDQLKKLFEELQKQVPQLTKSLNSVPKLTDGDQKKQKTSSRGQK